MDPDPYYYYDTGYFDQDAEFFGQGDAFGSEDNDDNFDSLSRDLNADSLTTKRAGFRTETENASRTEMTEEKASDEITEWTAWFLDDGNNIYNVLNSVELIPFEISEDQMDIQDKVFQCIWGLCKNTPYVQNGKFIEENHRSVYEHLKITLTQVNRNLASLLLLFARNKDGAWSAIKTLAKVDFEDPKDIDLYKCVIQFLKLDVNETPFLLTLGTHFFRGSKEVDGAKSVQISSKDFTTHAKSGCHLLVGCKDELKMVVTCYDGTEDDMNSFSQKLWITCKKVKDLFSKICPLRLKPLAFQHVVDGLIETDTLKDSKDGYYKICCILFDNQETLKTSFAQNEDKNQRFDSIKKLFARYSKSTLLYDSYDNIKNAIESWVKIHGDRLEYAASNFEQDFYYTTVVENILDDYTYPFMVAKLQTLLPSFPLKLHRVFEGIATVMITAWGILTLGEQDTDLSSANSSALKNNVKSLTDNLETLKKIVKNRNLVQMTSGFSTEEIQNTKKSLTRVVQNLFNHVVSENGLLHNVRKRKTGIHRSPTKSAMNPEVTSPTKVLKNVVKQYKYLKTDESLDLSNFVSSDNVNTIEEPEIIWKVLIELLAFCYFPIENINPSDVDPYNGVNDGVNDIKRYGVRMPNRYEFGMEVDSREVEGLMEIRRDFGDMLRILKSNKQEAFVYALSKSLTIVAYAVVTTMGGVFNTTYSFVIRKVIQDLVKFEYIINGQENENLIEKEKKVDDEDLLTKMLDKYAKSLVSIISSTTRSVLGIDDREESGYRGYYVVPADSASSTGILPTTLKISPASAGRTRTTTTTTTSTKASNSPNDIMSSLMLIQKTKEYEELEKRYEQFYRSTFEILYALFFSESKLNELMGTQMSVYDSLVKSVLKWNKKSTNASVEPSNRRRFMILYAEIKAKFSRIEKMNENLDSYEKFKSKMVEYSYPSLPVIKRDSNTSGRGNRVQRINTGELKQDTTLLYLLTGTRAKTGPSEQVYGVPISMHGLYWDFMIDAGTDIVTDRYRLIVSALFPRLRFYNHKDVLNQFIYPLMSASSVRLLSLNTNSTYAGPKNMEDLYNSDKIKNMLEYIKDHKRVHQNINVKISENDIDQLSFESSNSDIPLLSAICGGLGGEKVIKKKDIEIIPDIYNSEDFLNKFGVPLFDATHYENISLLRSFEVFFATLDDISQTGIDLLAMRSLVPTVSSFYISDEKKGEGLERYIETLKKFKTSAASASNNLFTTVKLMIHKKEEEENFVPIEVHTIEIFKSFSVLVDATKASVSIALAMLEFALNTAKKSKTKKKDRTIYKTDVETVKPFAKNFMEAMYTVSMIKRLLVKCREKVIVWFKKYESPKAATTTTAPPSLGKEKDVNGNRRYAPNPLLYASSDPMYFKMLHALVIGDGLNNLVRIVSVLQRTFKTLRIHGLRGHGENKIAGYPKRKDATPSKGKKSEYIISLGQYELLVDVLSISLEDNPKEKGRYEKAFTTEDTQKFVQTSTYMIEKVEKWTAIIQEAYVARLKKMSIDRSDDDVKQYMIDLYHVSMYSMTAVTSLYSQYYQFFSEKYKITHRPGEKFRTVTKSGKTVKKKRYIPNLFSEEMEATTEKIGISSNESKQYVAAVWRECFGFPFRGVYSEESLGIIQGICDNWTKAAQYDAQSAKSFFEIYYAGIGGSLRGNQLVLGLPKPISPPRSYLKDSGPFSGPFIPGSRNLEITLLTADYMPDERLKQLMLPYSSLKKPIFNLASSSSDLENLGSDLEELSFDPGLGPDIKELGSDPVIDSDLDDSEDDSLLYFDSNGFSSAIFAPLEWHWGGILSQMGVRAMSSFGEPLSWTHRGGIKIGELAAQKYFLKKQSNELDERLDYVADITSAQAYAAPDGSIWKPDYLDLKNSLREQARFPEVTHLFAFQVLEKRRLADVKAEKNGKSKEDKQKKKNDDATSSLYDIFLDFTENNKAIKREIVKDHEGRSITLFQIANNLWVSLKGPKETESEKEKNNETSIQPPDLPHLSLSFYSSENDIWHLLCECKTRLYGTESSDNAYNAWALHTYDYSEPRFGWINALNHDYDFVYVRKPDFLTRLPSDERRTYSFHFGPKYKKPTKKSAATDDYSEIKKKLTDKLSEEFQIFASEKELRSKLEEIRDSYRKAEEEENRYDGLVAADNKDLWFIQGKDNEEQVPEKIFSGRLKDLDAIYDVYALNKTGENFFRVNAGGCVTGNIWLDEHYFSDNGDYYFHRVKVYDDLALNFVSDVFCKKATESFFSNVLRPKGKSGQKSFTVCQIFQEDFKFYGSSSTHGSASLYKKMAGFREIPRKKEEEEEEEEKKMGPVYIRPLLSEAIIQEYSSSKTELNVVRDFYPSFVVKTFETYLLSSFGRTKGIHDDKLEKLLHLNALLEKENPIRIWKLHDDFESKNISLSTNKHYVAGHILTNYKIDAYMREIPTMMNLYYESLTKEEKYGELNLEDYDDRDGEEYGTHDSLRNSSYKVDVALVETEHLTLELCMATLKYDFMKTKRISQNSNAGFRTKMFGHGRTDKIESVKRETARKRLPDYTFDDYDVTHYWDNRETEAIFNVLRFENDDFNNNLSKSYRPREVLKNIAFMRAASDFFQGWGCVWPMRNKTYSRKTIYDLTNEDKHKGKASKTSVIGDLSNSMSLLENVVLPKSDYKAPAFYHYLAQLEIYAACKRRRFVQLPNMDISCSEKAFSSVLGQNPKDLQEILIRCSKALLYNATVSDSTSSSNSYLNQSCHPEIPYAFWKPTNAYVPEEYAYKHGWADTLCFAKALCDTTCRLGHYRHISFCSDYDVLSNDSRPIPCPPSNDEYLRRKGTYCKPERAAYTTNSLIETLMSSFLNETEKRPEESYDVDYRSEWFTELNEYSLKNSSRYKLALALCDHMLITTDSAKYLVWKEKEYEVESPKKLRGFYGLQDAEDGSPISATSAVLGCWKNILLIMGDRDYTTYARINRTTVNNPDYKRIAHSVTLERIHFITMVFMPLLMTTLKTKGGHLWAFCEGICAELLKKTQATNLVELVSGKQLKILYHVAAKYDSFKIESSDGTPAARLNQIDRMVLLKYMIGDTRPTSLQDLELSNSGKKMNWISRRLFIVNEIYKIEVNSNMSETAKVEDLMNLFFYWANENDTPTASVRSVIGDVEDHVKVGFDFRSHHSKAILLETIKEKQFEKNTLQLLGLSEYEEKSKRKLEGDIVESKLRAMRLYSMLRSMTSDFIEKVKERGTLLDAVSALNPGSYETTTLGLNSLITILGSSTSELARSVSVKLTNIEIRDSIIDVIKTGRTNRDEAYRSWTLDAYELELASLRSEDTPQRQVLEKNKKHLENDIVQIVKLLGLTPEQFQEEKTQIIEKYDEIRKELDKIIEDIKQQEAEQLNIDFTNEVSINKTLVAATEEKNYDSNIDDTSSDTGAKMPSTCELKITCFGRVVEARYTCALKDDISTAVIQKRACDECRDSLLIKSCLMSQYQKK
jgi:hypothetical protein